jgi:predicted ATPase
MGIHTGEPIRTDEGYAGMDVHRAARIAAVGYGGQVLVSQTSRDLLGDQAELRDLGAHRLKDLTQAQRIYQLGDGDFPPLKSLNRTNLPVTATALVGREQELAELRELLGNGTRLVTVTGAGGSGKTRLALQVAAELSDDFGDGVFFVPLAPVQDAELVAPMIEQTVGLRDLADLRDSRALLVLDNMEHLLEAADQVSSLLANAPRLKLLTTSRAPLRVSGEHEYALDPLPQDQAVELFLDRARAVRRDVVLDDAVKEICVRLDGLPLALELAASRVKVLDPQHLLERLERRLPLLTGGARDAPERQQTLRATIEWSYELLGEPLRQALRRLSVFAGSFSLEAAESVTGTDLEQIAQLTDWSLIKPTGEGRFFMLETIREYADDKLDQVDEQSRTRDYHLGFFLDLVVEAEPNLTGPDQAEWYDRLVVEQDNIREALEHACETSDGERALMLAGSIWRFWINRGQIDEASLWYERALAIGGDVSPIARGRGLFGAANMKEARGDLQAVVPALEEVLDALRASGETRWLILATTHLAIAYGDSGELERAQALFDEALALARETGDLRGEAIARINLGHLRMMEGNVAAAEATVEEALAAMRVVGDVYGIAGCLADLALFSVRRGELDSTVVQLRESLRLSSSIGDTYTSTRSLPVAAGVASARGDFRSGAILCAAAQNLSKTHGFALDPLPAELTADTTAAARVALGDAFDEAWAAGERLDAEAAVQLALAAID